jgi:hypothetical protein
MMILYNPVYKKPGVLFMAALFGPQQVNFLTKGPNFA